MAVVVDHGDAQGAQRRLDAIVYRAKFAPTVFAARQLVSHGHITVNGKRVNIPSYSVKVGDVVAVLIVVAVVVALAVTSAVTTNCCNWFVEVYEVRFTL